MTKQVEAAAVPAAGARLGADIGVPEPAVGVVVFAHGSGSSRHSPRNRAVAATLNDAGFATVLVDLLTEGEERLDARTRELRFDIGLLAHRLIGVVDWLGEQPHLRDLPVGLFGASTGAAAALVAAAERPGVVAAVVSRGGRPDLAESSLPAVEAPTLLLVGGRDALVRELNQRAARLLGGPHRLSVVRGATHLFEEPGTLDEVAAQATDWFQTFLSR
jgi:putative phosphoribosyl transferase